MNECPVCGEEFDSGESLHGHVREVHPGRCSDDLSPEEMIIAGILGGDLDL